MTVNLNNTLISYQAAQHILAQVAGKFSGSHGTYDNQQVETLALTHAMGRLLAHDYLSPIHVPSFNNSAMDGFAVQSHVVNAHIAQHGSLNLPVTGSIQAGDETNIQINANAHLTWEIMTGAPVPEIFDVVIPIENVVITGTDAKKTITISEQVLKGKNIRQLGSDYHIRQLVVAKNTLIQAQHIMALATVGIQHIDVIKKTRLAIISTGNELAKKTSQSLASGKIFNSNQPFLTTFCQNLNCEAVFTGRCPDNQADFSRLLDTALEKNVKIIISTGAVSMGKYDFIPQALLARGATIHFHKAKIRPGKPILFAELPNGVLYFGLPGNPIAAASGMRFFVAPLLAKIQGLPSEKFLTAKLLKPINSKQGFRVFAKAYAYVDTCGQLGVEMLQDQGSYQSRSFAQSNCWLIIAEDKTDIAVGELLEIAPMVPNQMFF